MLLSSLPANPPYPLSLYAAAAASPPSQISIGSGTSCALWSVVDPSTLQYSSQYLYCWGIKFGPKPMWLGSTYLGTGRTAVAVSAGGTLECARLDNGSVRCWNVVTAGPGAVPFTVSLGTNRTAVAISAGQYAACMIRDNGSIWCIAQNNAGAWGGGQVGLPAGRTAVAISTGTFHKCAVLDDGSATCWGTNDRGQLGIGDSGTRSVSSVASLPPINLGTGHKAVAVEAGAAHSCVLLDNAKVKC
jgi:hypothetical protein